MARLSSWRLRPAISYAGLWYPIIVALITAVIGFIFLRETKDTDISKT